MAKYRKILYLLAVLVMICSCGYNDFDAHEPFGNSGMAANTDIATIRSMYYGMAVTVKDAMVVAGTVTANDRSGNLYKSFIVEDASGALEICAGMYDLHNIYREGQRVKVSLRGCAIGMENGVLCLGLAPDSWGAGRVKDFGSRVVIDKYVVRDAEVAEPVARSVSAENLEAGMCGRLVRIDGLTLAAEEIIEASATGENVKWYYVSPEAYYTPTYCTRKFLTDSGTEVWVATSRYASFAGETVPQTRVSLTGILMCGKFDGSKDIYALLLRDVNDVETY